MQFSAQERKEFAKTIKPSVKGQSDKFSWRLYQRALKRGRERVYLMAWSFIDGYRAPSLDDLEAGNTPAYQIAIGVKNDDWFNGNTLRNICTPGTAKHDWAYSPAHHVAEWIDITDWFWSNYLRIGRCLFWKYEHSWLQINRNARKCEYCGKQERRSIKKVQTIKRQEIWA